MSYLKTVYDKKREPKTSYPRALIEYLIRRFKIKKDDKLLELGIGNGYFLKEFAEKGINCYGVDREIFPELDKRITAKKTDLFRQKFPFPDKYFDVVYSKSVVEHFYSREVELIMSETKRVLKPGGKVIILVPDWPSQMVTFFEDYTQVHPYDTLALSDLLKIFGFKNVVSERFYQLPELWKYPYLKIFSQLLSVFISTPTARKISDLTGLKFVRWSVELMVLGYGEK